MKTPFDLLVVGDLNVDLIMDGMNGLPQPEKELIAKEMTLTLGGSSAIFAVNISRLGSRTTFCGLLGTDRLGDLVLYSLKSGGVDTTYIRMQKELKTGVTVVLNLGEKRMMVTHPGAMTRLTPDDVPVGDFGRFRHLHVSSPFLQPGLKNRLHELFTTAGQAGLTTSMDPQWDPEEMWDLDLAQLLPALDFFLPNEQELLNLTGSGSLDQALERLAPSGCTVVVKRGRQGALMKRAGEITEEPACRIPGFRDAIGAGDSFNAGFIHAFLNGKSPADCLKFGNLAGAVSTTGPGGTDAIGSYEQIIETGKTMGVFLE